jgi:outer membrane biosynthesis protein TonB
MNRLARIAVVASALSLGLPLAGCESFDPTDLFSSDMFTTKKKLQGDRKAVFPEGTPGVAQGVPQELIKGYEPPPEPQPAEAAAPPEEPKAKPKPKPKPKTVAKPAEPAGPSPSATAQPSPGQWPDPPQAQRQQQQPQQRQQPAGPQPSGQVAWPDPPTPGTFSR